MSNQNKTAELDNSDTFNNNNSSNGTTLSDFRTEDIKTFNDTANSSQTLASSLSGVDLPVYEYSNQEKTPAKPNKVMTDDWDRSPQLGILTLKVPIFEIFQIYSQPSRFIPDY